MDQNNLGQQSVPQPTPQPASQSEQKSEQKAPKKKKFDLKSLSKLDAKALFGKKDEPELVTGTATKFEISLVPKVKAEMIKSLKMRNLVLFICIIIVAVMGGITAILGSVVTGQNVTMGTQDKKIEAMSTKINSFEGLDEYLTIQDQLGNIAAIQDNRKILSRVFSFLNVLLPSGPDKITISELNVDLSENTLSFAGQADAGVEPFIDYRVLESFKKSVMLVKYDYGRYVDAEDNEIPTRCIVESGQNGGTLMEGNSIYAYWLMGKSGCEAAATEREKELAALATEIETAESEAAEGTGEKMSASEILERTKEIYEDYKDSVQRNWYDEWLEANALTRYTDDNLSESERQSIVNSYNAWLGSLSEEERWVVNQEIEQGVDYRDVKIMKIWRTPQFSEWYKKDYMDLSGGISGVPHFVSECINYSGTELDETIRWTSNNECMLMDSDITISNSSNGRDASNNLVLRFEAAVTLNEEPLKFANKHVMAIGPNGQNVTDSYVQIEGMFGERAEDCQSNDVVCVANSTNATGEGGNNGEE